GEVLVRFEQEFADDFIHGCSRKRSARVRRLPVEVLFGSRGQPFGTVVRICECSSDKDTRKTGQGKANLRKNSRYDQGIWCGRAGYGACPNSFRRAGGVATPARVSRARGATP